MTENEIASEIVYAQQVQDALEAGEDPPERPQERNYKLIFNKEYQMQGVHQGRQNAPTESNEVAAVFELDNDGVPGFYRDFHVYARANPDPAGQRHENMYPQSPHFDPMTYPLLFPYGEKGWSRSYKSIGYNHFGGLKHFTQLQYKQALLQVRSLAPYRPILDAKNLTQQFIVDSYCQIEASNLDWLYQHQEQIHAQKYTTVHDAVARRAARAGVTAQPAIILPSTFQGSARHMRQLCLDAMSIFARFGNPDLFITFTCNPNWPDIFKQLRPGQSPSDRPDIVARVFKFKLDEMMNDIKGGLFGPVLCMVHTIEFQKRGLPHAHILMTLQNGHKPVDAASIDRIVCAQLPDREANPRLFDIVTRTMTHGPCRPGLCMVDGRCSKKYTNETVVIPNDYPLYRREDMPPVKVTQGNKDTIYTNAYVVPSLFNPFLSLKYNTHINVEVVTGMKSSIKYLYKYIFKGYDVISLKVVDGQRVMVCNEINNYLNCRYVSAPEATWRIFEFRMHDRTHAVIGLPVHLENTTQLDFDEGIEIIPELEERTLTTILEAFFELNERDENARQYLYTQIPEHYVFSPSERRWNPRQQRGDRIIARIHDVAISSKERHSLRLLLLNVSGSRSFTDIRNINGRQFSTNHEAAQFLNLIRDDTAYNRAFDDWRLCKCPRGTTINFVMTAKLREKIQQSQVKL